MGFDPYDQWLKIPPGAGPPSHYDLLGLTPFEADPRRIHDAGMERIADIRRYQLGPHGAAAIKLLGELALAFDCLSTPERKVVYDDELRAALEAAAPAVGRGGKGDSPPPNDGVDGSPEADTEIDAQDDAPPPRLPARPRPPAPPSVITVPLQASARTPVLAAVPVAQSRGATPAPAAVATGEPGELGAPIQPAPRPRGLPNWAWIGAGAALGLAAIGLCAAVVVALSDSREPPPKPAPAETAHIATLPKVVVPEGQPIVVPLAVDDPAATNAAVAEGGSWRFFLHAGAPSGAHIDKITGAFTWTPDESQGPGSYRIALGAKQPGRADLVGEIKIDVREVNQAPRITAIADATIDEEQPYSIAVRARDDDLPPNRLTFSLEPGAPEGMRIDPESGRLTWTPSESQGPGKYLVGVKVSDDFSPPGSDVKRFSIAVREVNRPPVFEPIDDQKVELYELATVRLKASDPDLPPNKLTFSIRGEPPPGARIDDPSSTFLWRPAPEFYGKRQKVSLRVTDDGAEPLSDDARFTIDAGRTAINSIGMPLVYFRPGKFRMGFEHPPDANQHSARDVSIARPFYLGRDEVTADEFALFAREQKDFVSEAERDHRGGQTFNGLSYEYDPRTNWHSPPYEQDGDQPVVNVTWNDAKQFCNWLTKREGRQYRLPTEAEWEYCCRAGTDTIYPSGDDASSLAEVANIADASYLAMLEDRFPMTPFFGDDSDLAAPWDDGFAYTAPAGSFRPNAFGLYDMPGNVAEWCEDAFGGGRIARGGSFRSLPPEVASALRQWHAPRFRRDDLGFRVVADGGDPVTRTPATAGR